MTMDDQLGVILSQLSDLQGQLDALRGTSSANVVFGPLQTDISSFGFCQGPFTLEIDQGAPDIVSIFIPDWVKTLLRVQLRWQQKAIRVPYGLTSGGVSTPSVAANATFRVVAAGAGGAGAHHHFVTATGVLSNSEDLTDSVASSTHQHLMPHTHSIGTTVRDLTLPGGINILANVDSVLVGQSTALAAGPIDILPQLIDGRLSQPGGKGPLYGYHDVQFTAGSAAPAGIRLDVFFDFFVMGKPLHV